EASIQRQFPPIINILQSDKQYDAFEQEDAENITKKMYGKLFIRTNDRKNKFADLVDAVEGTVLKIETGYEILEKEENSTSFKVVASGTPMMNKQRKEQWMYNNPEKRLRNMVKIILCPGLDPDEVRTQVAEGEMPFILLVIKGSAWGRWFDTQKEMDAMAMASTVYGHKKSSQLLVSAFSFVVTSTKEKNNDGIEYYVPMVKVSLNDPEVAFGFKDFVFQLKDLSLFYKVAEKIEAEQTAEISDEDNTVIAESILA